MHSRDIRLFNWSQRTMKWANDIDPTLLTLIYFQKYIDFVINAANSMEGKLLLILS